jgi:hypothetical protein
MDNGPKSRMHGLTDLWNRSRDLPIIGRHFFHMRLYNLTFHSPNVFVTLFPLSCLPLLPRGAIRHRRQNQLRSGDVVLLDCHVPSAEGLLNYPSSFYPTSLPSSCSD